MEWKKCTELKLRIKIILRLLYSGVMLILWSGGPALSLQLPPFIPSCHSLIMSRLLLLPSLPLSLSHHLPSSSSSSSPSLSPPPPPPSCPYMLLSLQILIALFPTLRSSVLALCLGHLISLSLPLWLPPAQGMKLSFTPPSLPSLF